jgi:hypothetical protein
VVELFAAWRGLSGEMKEQEFCGVYDALLPRLRLGDTMRIRLRNNLRDEPTNLHLHDFA